MAVSANALNILATRLFKPGTSQIIYVALHVDLSLDPTDNSGEVSTSGTGYGRVGIAEAGWTLGTGDNRGQASNAAIVRFNSGNAIPADWGNVGHYSLWLDQTSSAATNFLGSARLSSSRLIENGDTVSIAIGGIVFDINPD